MTASDRVKFQLQRRSMLRATLGGVISFAVTPVMVAAASPSRLDHRNLSFLHFGALELYHDVQCAKDHQEPCF